MEPKPDRYLLTKLSHLKNPLHKPEDYRKGPIPDDFKMFGYFLNPPRPGHRFILINNDGGDYISTSEVATVYEVSGKEGYDKLVLPTAFPEPLRLDLPDPQIGDIFFATTSSLYFLRLTPLESA